MCALSSLWEVLSCVGGFALFSYARPKSVGHQVQLYSRLFFLFFFHFTIKAVRGNYLGTVLSFGLNFIITDNQIFQESILFIASFVNNSCIWMFVQQFDINSKTSHINSESTTSRPRIIKTNNFPLEIKIINEILAQVQ